MMLGPYESFYVFFPVEMLFGVIFGLYLTNPYSSIFDPLMCVYMGLLHVYGLCDVHVCACHVYIPRPECV